MFTSNHRGFTLDFDNGYSLSVQWNQINHCSARRDPDTMESKTAEILVVDRLGDCVKLGNGDVAGYVALCNVARIITELNTPYPDHDMIVKVANDH